MSESDGFLNTFFFLSFISFIVNTSDEVLTMNETKLTKEDFWKNQIKGWNQSLPDSPYELEVFSQPLSENPSVTTHLPGSIQIEV